MESQDLKKMFSEQQSLLKHLQVRHHELARTDEDSTERWAAVLRQAEEKISETPIRRNQVRQFKSSLTRTQTLLSKLANKVDEECERKEVALKEAKESEDFYQGTSTTLSVQIMQSVSTDMANCLINDAVKKKNRREKSNQQQPIVGIKMVGSIDELPWSTAFKKMYVSEDWDVKMASELSIWESLVRNPGFSPFTTIQVGEDKWERRIDQGNEKLSFLKKSLGDEVHNSVTTALMDMEQFNASGRYPVPLPWVFEESRMATLKEAIAHLGSIIEALVGAAPPAKKSRASTCLQALVGAAPPAKKSRATTRPARDVSHKAGPSYDANMEWLEI